MEQLQVIQSKIYEIRGQKVMLDKDLAELYQVTTGNLNKAVKRNLKRFPPDFMFQLTEEEWQALRFQNGIIKKVTMFASDFIIGRSTGAVCPLAAELPPR